jgi:hypothetical protein
MNGQNFILFLDLRNECRRQWDDTGCKSISEKELEVCQGSKTLEIKIAQQEFDITLNRVFSFSPCWDDSRWDRILDALRPQPPPYYHETRHMSWMQHSALSFFAERLLDKTMQEWPAKEILESCKKAGLPGGREISPNSHRFRCKI